MSKTPSCEQVWLDVQKTLRTNLPIVLAGGAVRDQLLHRTPKDFDIFILNVPDRDRYTRRIIRDTLNQHFKPEPSLYPGDYKEKPVSTFKYKNIPIQVMLSKEKTIIDLLNSFDWNISLFA